MSRQLGDRFSGTLAEALKQTADSFDVHVVLRPGRILFFRRYTDFREAADLPVEELQLIVRDVATAMRSVSQGANVGSLGRNESALLSSLSQSQWRQMQGDGLPVGALTTQQQRFFHAINQTTYCLDSGEKVAALDILLRRWNQTELIAKPTPFGGVFWTLRVPDSARFGTFTSISLPARTSHSKLTQAHTSPPFLVTERGARAILSPVNHVQVVAGSATLSALAHSLEENSHITLRLPRFASQRRLVVGDCSGPVNEAVAAIADLYGWVPMPMRDGTVALERTRVGAVGSLSDLHKQALAAIPPSLRCLLYRSQPERIAWTEKQIEIVTKGRTDEDWAKAVMVKSLSEEEQSRLAQVFVVDTLSRVTDTLLSPEGPPLWFAQPQLGVLRWIAPGPRAVGPRKELRGGAQAQVLLVVPYPNGSTGGWGLAAPGKPPR